MDEIISIYVYVFIFRVVSVSVCDLSQWVNRTEWAGSIEIRILKWLYIGFDLYEVFLKHKYLPFLLLLSSAQNLATVYTHNFAWQTNEMWKEKEMDKTKKKQLNHQLQNVWQPLQ